MQRQNIKNDAKLSTFWAQADAYGDPQVDNGVYLFFGRTDNADGGTTSEFTYDQSTGTFGPRVEVRLATNLNSVSLGVAIVHEGQHVLDAMGFLSTFRRCPPGACPGTDYWWDDSRKVTRYQTEENAFLVTDGYLKAIGVTVEYGASKTKLGKGARAKKLPKDIELIIKETENGLTPADKRPQIDWPPLPQGFQKPPP
jgi:hypothetical protein